MEKNPAPVHMCHGQGCRVFWGMGKIPPLIGILIMGPYKPPTIGLMTIPYYIEIMGVDRPWHIWRIYHYL